MVLRRLKGRRDGRGGKEDEMGCILGKWAGCRNDAHERRSGNSFPSAMSTHQQ